MDDSALPFLKVQQLKKICREHGLPVVGLKQDIVRRIEEYRSQNGGDWSEPEVAKQWNNAADEHGRTPLFHAALRGDAWEVLQFLAAGARESDVDKKRRTALMFAASEGRTDVIYLLLGAHADVNGVDVTNATALMYAANGGYSDVVRVLLAAGARVDVVDNRNCTALAYAVERKSDHIARMLREAMSSASNASNANDVAILHAGEMVAVQRTRVECGKPVMPIADHDKVDDALSKPDTITDNLTSQSLASMPNREVSEEEV